MTSRGMTRGPLPATVYWRRRAVVLGVAVLLVVVIAKLLGSGGGGDDSGAASLSGSTTGSSPSSDAGGASPTPGADSGSAGQGTGQGTGKGQGSGKSGKNPPLAVPQGECTDADISATPSVQGAQAGRDVTLTLTLQTLTSPACTWQVSAKHLTVKITQDGDDVWSTLQCPRAIQPQQVVVRQAVATAIQITWNARRSDDTCSAATAPAMPGSYDIEAAALGGEPADATFDMTLPTAPTITRTAQPTEKPTQKSTQKSTGKPSVGATKH